MQLPPLIFGTLIKRYKRFLADVELEDGRVVTAHCPNTGRMTTCAESGWKVALSESDNPKRKYKHTWEMVHNGSCWICVNTAQANKVAFEALATGCIPELAGYDEVLREQTFGESRFDLLLQSTDKKCYVEVKSVTLRAGDGAYAFPDAVTARGQKHLNELVNVVKAGHRAAMLYLILRSDGDVFRPAHEIDPEYADAFIRAQQAGVEMHAWRATLGTESITLTHPVEVKVAPNTGLLI